MSLKAKIITVVILSIIVTVISIGIGSVYVTPYEIIQIIFSKITGADINIKPVKVGIIWSMRLPRVILAFLVGSVLSISGAVMQSVLKNPLASSYTLGVSSGAAFGVGLFVFLGLYMPQLGIFMFPIVGLVSGVSTVILAITFSAKMDVNMSNNTILLVGMVFSLFINAMLTLITSMSKETLEKMIHWQMGSFALKDWSFIFLLLPFSLIGIAIFIQFSRELDNLSFGEEAAFIVGLDVKKTKWILLSVSAALTGFSVAIVGVIGFVDLITPQIVRKIFGSSHKIVIPMVALVGGTFMVIADLISRTIISPTELPVGAITAIIGAPFFIYIFFRKNMVSR
jgi:iron complex transport system permease protein